MIDKSWCALYDAHIQAGRNNGYHAMSLQGPNSNTGTGEWFMAATQANPFLPFCKPDSCYFCIIKQTYLYIFYSEKFLSSFLSFYTELKDLLVNNYVLLFWLNKREPGINMLVVLLKKKTYFVKRKLKTPTNRSWREMAQCLRLFDHLQENPT